jgi:hypothetical protein
MMNKVWTSVIFVIFFVLYGMFSANPGDDGENQTANVTIVGDISGQVQTLNGLDMVVPAGEIHAIAWIDGKLYINELLPDKTVLHAYTLQEDNLTEAGTSVLPAQEGTSGRTEGHFLQGTDGQWYYMDGNEAAKYVGGAFQVTERQSLQLLKSESAVLPDSVIDSKLDQQGRFYMAYKKDRNWTVVQYDGDGKSLLEFGGKSGEYMHSLNGFAVTSAYVLAGGNEYISLWSLDGKFQGQQEVNKLFTPNAGITAVAQDGETVYLLCRGPVNDGKQPLSLLRIAALTGA